MNLLQHVFGTDKLVEAIMLRNWPEVQLIVNERPRKARILYRIVSKSGPTVALPLHHCLMNDAPYQVVRDLMKAYPVGIFLCDSIEKRYPLHIACEAEASLHSYKVIKTLLEASPDLAMVRDKSGRLPLHHAISNKAKLNVIAALLESSANMAATQPDGKGWYPLHLACSREVPYAIVQALVVAWPGAVLKKVGAGRTTPIDILHAGNAGDKQSILVLLQNEAAELQNCPASPKNSMMISVANCCGRVVL
mmetsp:Transcript_29658/g.48942  ORF Transcript_29658/g.48942 Transcript_29658/m.48942 type:complete len:250 (+) Transcript_29658:190-939(+)